MIGNNGLIKDNNQANSIRNILLQDKRNNLGNRFLSNRDDGDDIDGCHFRTHYTRVDILPEDKGYCSSLGCRNLAVRSRLDSS